MEATHLPEEIETKFEAVDPVVHAVDKVAGALPPEAESVLQGKWLGHPLHPMLTDLPIGFWTSSMLFDLCGRRLARTSTAMAGLGVATAVPTVAAGLAEWKQLPPDKKRVGAVHMLSNALATVLYAVSVFARLRGKRGRGVAIGFLAGSVATLGGYLGGHLAFGSNNADDN